MWSTKTCLICQYAHANGYPGAPFGQAWSLWGHDIDVCIAAYGDQKPGDHTFGAALQRARALRDAS